ncbi:TM1266 family iron-only hydrogenase system putative regulator [Anaerotalea alkaliphila]|uniref:CopG family transcriptional regulator n=1 Tax=Anaerotalea alkaliphila TaxID=2662126 RepID=A0A7X5HY63_9FIRM|nr:TM1266 family iron-only hydrogenase system putative regulator [Anaerotalea alkaliphila]NDL68766.1 CopG family transcriptional regulator [Anaerotalea alkaliphila]
MPEQQNRIGVVGIVLEDPGSTLRLNEILHEHASIISGRMGIPQVRGRDVNVISLVVDGTTDDIGSLTGKLGTLPGVSVKSALSKKTYPL